MASKVYKKSSWDSIKSVLGPLIFTFVIVIMVMSGLRQTEEASRSEGLRILEESLHRAVVVSYALEGRYPESLAYIEENFGIHIDRTRYVVHYRVSGSNLFPEIIVIELMR
jgi:hypothetical protein